MYKWKMKEKTTHEIINALQILQAVSRGREGQV